MQVRESGIPGSSYCTERAGDGSCQCDVNVQPDGLPSLRLLGWSFFPFKQFSLYLLQSVLSEKAPFILIALVCLLASIPGRKYLNSYESQ